MLLNDKSKTVRLFVENLLWGKISFDVFHTASNLDVEQLIEHSNDTYDTITRWQKLYTAKDRLYNDDFILDELTDTLYITYMHGRIDGEIKGELHDEEFESKIKELEKDAEIWKLRFEQQKLENIALANELHDRENIISSYEKPAYKRIE
jgi:hypothetical protein